MGPASKRRGGSSSGDVGGSSGGAVVSLLSRKSSSSGSGGRVKERHRSTSDGSDRNGPSRRDNDDGGAGGRNRGGARSRLLARASAASSSSKDRSGGGGSSGGGASDAVAAAPSGGHSFSRSSRRGGGGSSGSCSGSDGGGVASSCVVGGGGGGAGGGGSGSGEGVAPTPRPKPLLDPTLLARGMSARSVGARVSGRIRPVAPADVEKDLRHMEAYGAACTAYAQQFFAYVNRELVANGHYGPVTMGPGLIGADAAAGGAIVNGGLDGKRGMAEFYDAVTGRYVAADPQVSHLGAGLRPILGPTVSMPVRIDPEEEKRLAILRKRVAASEAKREVLETEYLSLRAHYWYENQKLRKARRLTTGQLELLRELARRRGKVVALRRVRCAIARDVLKCLEYRSKTPARGGTSQRRIIGEAVEGLEYACGKKSNSHGLDDMDKSATKGRSSLGSKSPCDESHSQTKDMLEMWNLIEAQLIEAERACRTIELPPDLAAAKESMGQMSVGASIGEGSSKNESSAGRRSKSPVRNKAEDGDDSRENGSSKNKPEKLSKKTTEDGGKDKELGARKGKEPIEEEEHVVPWDSQFLPRTPDGVPVLLSYLSSAPDRGAGFASGNIMGSSQYQLSWIESNLPKTFDHPEYLAPYAEGQEELVRLREEVQYLKEELDLEKGNNRELQRQIIESRKRSDGVCAMMGMLRTETDAVLNRHNAILETSEARALAVELHHKALQEETEEEDDDDEDDEIDDEQGHADEIMPRQRASQAGGRRQRASVDGGSEPGAVVEGDADDELSVDEPDGGEGGATPVDDADEDSDYDEEQQVRLKEVIVPISGAAGTAAVGGEGRVSEDEEGEINEEEGEIKEGEEEGEINDEEAAGMKRSMQAVEIENTAKRRKL